MKQYIFGTLFAAVLLMAGSVLKAQPGGNLGLDNEDKFQVTNTYKAQLDDLKKPKLETPVAEKTKAPETEPMEYEEEDIKIETEFMPPRLKIADPPKERWPALYNGYLKAGFGRFATPIGHLYLNNGRNAKADVGLDLHHISASNGHVNFGEFRQNWGTVKGKYHLNEHTLRGKLYLYNHNYFFYADSITEGRPDLRDSIRNTFTRFEGEIGLAKNFKDGEIYYDAGLRFQNYSDRLNNTERHVIFEPKLGWSVDERFGAGMDGDITFSNSTIDSLQQNRIFLNFAPYLRFKLKELNARGGIRINSLSDSSTAFGAYPFLEATYGVLPGRLSVSAGLTGGMRYVKYYDLMMENRYLDLRRPADIRPVREKINLYGGVDAGFAKYFNLSVRGYYKKIENQLIYFNPQDGAYFQTVYDTNFRESGAELSLLFNKEDKIKAGVKANLRRFRTSNIAYNFAMPNTKIDVWASYNFARKVWVTAEVYYFGKRTMSVDSLGAAIEQPGQADINLYFDYSFNKRISVFLELNNILSNNYYRWYNYLERPLDIKAGATFAF